MSHAGSLSGVGGGKRCGLCILAKLFAQGMNLATVIPLPLLFSCPYTPLWPELLMSNCLKCSHHFHSSLGYCPWFHESEKGKHRLMAKVKCYLRNEMRI